MTTVITVGVSCGIALPDFDVNHSEGARVVADGARDGVESILRVNGRRREGGSSQGAETWEGAREKADVYWSAHFW